MAKARSRMADFALFVAVRIVVCVVQALSWPLALQLATGLSWLHRRWKHPPPVKKAKKAAA